MKIGLIGLGFIGKMLASALREEGFETAATTTNPEKITEYASLVNQVFYLENSNSLDEFCKTVDVVVVMVAPKNGASYEETYLKTAQSIISCKKLIYTSSTSVYGDHQGNSVVEESPLRGNPVLIETEKTYLKLSVPVTIFRLGGIYGETRQLKRRDPQPGWGESHLNIIHCKDCVRAIIFAIKTELTGIYNLVNDCHLKRKEFYRTDHFSEKSGEDKIVLNTKLKERGFTFDFPNC